MSDFRSYPEFLNYLNTNHELKDEIIRFNDYQFNYNIILNYHSEIDNIIKAKERWYNKEEWTSRLKELNSEYDRDKVNGYLLTAQGELIQWALQYLKKERVSSPEIKMLIKFFESFNFKENYIKELSSFIDKFYNSSPIKFNEYNSLIKDFIRHISESEIDTLVKSLADSHYRWLVENK